MAPIARMPTSIQPPADLFCTPPRPSPPITATRTTTHTDPSRRPHPATGTGPTTGTKPKTEQVGPGGTAAELRARDDSNYNNNNNNNNNNDNKPQPQPQPHHPAYLQQIVRENHHVPKPEWTEALAHQARDFYRQGVAHQRRRRVVQVWFVAGSSIYL
ncbi:hypothetical protein B0I37DRAFT_354442 [Chaetomium sp. MPI-CAGE-AT-0009]|nr:hypothetical protein B0I37DRAFT_354442 [Chaetomium sp. MPI-CAGE-AT-0009]